MIRIVCSLIVTGSIVAWSTCSFAADASPVSDAKVQAASSSTQEKRTELKQQEQKDRTPPASVDALLDEMAADKNSQVFIESGNRLYINLTREVQLADQVRNSQADIDALQKELSKQFSELNLLQARVSKGVDKKIEENPNIALLVTLYSSVKPDEAALLLKQLPLHVTETVMRRMSPKKSSKILSAMEPKFAAEISRRIIQSQE